MLIRALCVALVLCVSPASRWAASQCCQSDSPACEGEQSQCPVLPDGQCALASADHALTAIGTAPAPRPALTPVPAPSIAAAKTVARAPAAIHAPATPPAFLLYRSLRI